jgi:predicted metalloprotease
MRLDDLPESGNIEDRRGDEGGGGGIGGIPIGGGGIGIGTILILGLIGWALGIDPSLLISGVDQMNRGAPYEQQQGQRGETGKPSDEMGRFVGQVLGSTELVWKTVFSKEGRSYRAPTLILYDRVTRAACGGQAQSAMGPFYCPVDQKVYLDTSFFNEIERRFRGCSGKACQFAQAYVIAHEVGHHVQNLLGILQRSQQLQQASNSRAEANAIQVRVELQADCLAGLWANNQNQRLRAEGKPAFIEPGDIEAALQTAAAIGDDTLQKRAQGYAVPDSFTHGTSAQRQRWFEAGYRGGTLASCNTFAAQQL